MMTRQTVIWLCWNCGEPNTLQMLKCHNCDRLVSAPYWPARVKWWLIDAWTGPAHLWWELRHRLGI